MNMEEDTIYLPGIFTPLGLQTGTNEVVFTPLKPGWTPYLAAPDMHLPASLKENAILKCLWL